MKKDCCDFPDLKRPNYFFGQMLGVREFLGEQNYFREKMKLLNRTLHGWGVICGLTVSAVPPENPCPPADEKVAECDPVEKPRLRIDCGLALDCEGNELLLHRPLELDPLRHLTRRQQESQEPVTLYVTVCYCAKPIEPSRPLQTQECGITSDCQYGWTLDTVRFNVTLDPPRSEEHCNPCCKACHEDDADCEKKGDVCCCLVLARIDGFVPGRPIEASQIDNGVRRLLTTYDFVRVSGVNWVHGGVYTSDEAYAILGGPGDFDDDEDYDADDDAQRGALEIHLTREVRTSTLQQGVLDVWIVEGGTGRSGDIEHLAGDFVPNTGDYTNVIRYRQRSTETLEDGDCVLIMLRSEFVLDRCFRAVMGANIGGKAPQLPGTLQPSSARAPEDWPEPSWYPPPWRTGGTEGSNFVSWFFIGDAVQKKSKKEARNAQQ